MRGNWILKSFRSYVDKTCLKATILLHILQEALIEDSRFLFWFLGFHVLPVFRLIVCLLVELLKNYIRDSLYSLDNR